MYDMKGVIDYSLPPLCRKVKWCHDWTDAPLIGTEPLGSWYPPFSNEKASPFVIREREKKNAGRMNYVKNRMFYPSEETVLRGREVLGKSDEIINEILGEL